MTAGIPTFGTTPTIQIPYHSEQELSKQQKLDSELLKQQGCNSGTLGDRLADRMAAEVGSWTFLIAQSAILAGWIALNVLPGVPHWDNSPFVLLNLVFSFASAYTAPIVLMSQNRQAEQDRQKAEKNHHVNQSAADNIELLHAKMDNLLEQNLELRQVVQQQQHSLNQLQRSVESTVNA